jgi:signal transduction histidine kinase
LRTVNSVVSGEYLGLRPALVLGPELAFLLLYSLAYFSGVLRPARTRHVWLHLYFVVQSSLIVFAYSRAPDMDYITGLFILLAYQAGLSFSGRTLWIWIGLFAALTVGPLIAFLGLLRGLGLGLVAVAIEVINAAYVTIGREVVAARARSQAMLLDLQETHRQLERYAGEVEELAGIQERNRLAREIHDSVSQTLFSIALNTRAARLLLENDPTKVRAQLQRLQGLVQSALAQMRGLIAELRQTTES